MKKYLFTLLAITIIFTSCQNNNKNNNINTEKKNILTIEAILPLTGGAAILGKDIKEGIEVALLQHKNIKVIYKDSKNNPKDAVSIVENSLMYEKPDIYISAMSGVTTAIIDLIDKNNKILLSTVTGKANITKLGNNIYRFYYTNDIQGETVIKYIINSLMIKKINVVYINDDYGVSGKDYLINYINSYGGYIGNIISIEKNEVNIKSSLSKISEKKNEATVIIAYGKTLINIITQLKEINNKSVLFTYTGIADPTVLKTIGNAANGIYLSIGDFNPFEPNNKTQKDFFKTIKSKYHKKPSHYHAFGFDLIGIIDASIKKGNRNLDSLKYYLKNINYSGVLGNISTTDSREITLKQRIAIIENDKIKYITDYE